MSLLYKTRVAMWLPAKITSSCIWVAILVDWLFYIGMPVVRTDGRSFGRSVYGHVITKFSARMTRTARAWWRTLSDRISLPFLVFFKPPLTSDDNLNFSFSLNFDWIHLNLWRFRCHRVVTARHTFAQKQKIIILHETKADQTIAHYTEISFWFRS